MGFNCRVKALTVSFCLKHQRKAWKSVLSDCFSSVDVFQFHLREELVHEIVKFFVV